MGSSDLDVLLDMGFEKWRAEIAVKKSGGLQGSLEWLEENQDKTQEQIEAAAATTTSKLGSDDPNEEPPALNPGEEARSLVCNDCGKKFRSTAQAEFHATKTEHVDFSESTEEIAPLTAEEKKAKLEDLRQKLAEKRAIGSVTDKEEQKRNEAIRRKATKETQDIKEDLQKKEQIKEAAAKRREKQAEVAAKERIRQKIKDDQEQRRLKAAKEKAEREGKAPPADPIPSALPVPSGPVTSKPAAAYSEARLRLMTPGGTIQKTLPADTTLFEVAAAIEQENGTPVVSFSTNFPKKSYPMEDFGMTLKEAGMVPSAVLIVK
ncbi:MAG: hypothetical protein M1829_006906 [Trizodia sp. TS-e1964]|nr:MAG: hypothetical protein M1829_006906 [Trizodia sp. TS-e1964]